VAQRRRLEDIQRRLVAARESVAVLDEQVAKWREDLDEARIRALVSETPLQAKEYDDLSRQVSVATAELERRALEVSALVQARDELLRVWTPEG
jgi:predicted  nucleic acid-binding Zn-ribbon protein